MANMVLGFLIDDKFDWVLCIQKSHPAWMAGYCNGIGGKMGPQEAPLDAMIREFKEETTGEVTDWHEFAIMEGGDARTEVKPWTMHCFVSVAPFKEIIALPIDDKAPGSDEELCIVPVKTLLGNLYTLPDLAWMIPMAIGVVTHRSRCTVFRIEELSVR